MTNQPSVADIARKASILRDLHAGPSMLVLPNAWDAASAKVIEGAGFPATASTSGGVAQALGFGDHEEAPPAEMLAASARIAAAVAIPVTVDFEAGYQWSPQEIVEKLIAAGAAGMNIEDSDHHGTDKLVNAEKQAERLAAIKAASKAAGVDLVLNARVDVFIHRVGTPDEQLVEGLRRARLYHDAGADCIYPIILSDEAMIAEFVKAVGPINLNVRRGGPLTLERLSALGVRRVSYATSIHREAMTFVEEVAKDIKAQVDALS